MTKRIVSGIFLLIALGALGLILAGALTSGEQLIVRFLTAIVVAALGLYVISDLRIQADESTPATTGRTTTVQPRFTTAEEPPPNSTAAFMATVTGKKSGRTADGASTGAATASAAAPAPTGELQAISPAAPSNAPAANAPSPNATPTPTPSPMATPAPTPAEPAVAAASAPAANASPGSSPYETDFEEAELWPFNAETPVLERPTDTVRGDELDELVAIFARKTEQELSQQRGAGVEAPQRPTPPEADTTKTGEATVEAATNATGVGDFLTTGTASPTDSAPRATASEDGASTPTNPTAVAAHSELIDDESASHLTEESITDSGDTTSSSENTTTSICGATPGGIDTGADATSEHESDSGSDSLPTHEPTIDLGAPVGIDDPVADEPEVVPATGIADTTTPVAPIVVPADEAEDGTEAELEALAATVASIDVSAYAEGPIAPIIDLRGPVGRIVEENPELEAAIRAGELDVVTSLIEQGLLSTDGPITDRDVRTMVYVAFTSSELRKILLAGGTLDSDRAELDLGDVEVFTPTGPTTGAAADIGRAPELDDGAANEGAPTLYDDQTDDDQPGAVMIDLRSEYDYGYGYELEAATASPEYAADSQAL